MKTDIPKREARRLALSYGRYCRAVESGDGQQIDRAGRKLASVQIHTGIFIIDQQKLLPQVTAV